MSTQEGSMTGEIEEIDSADGRWTGWRRRGLMFAYSALALVAAVVVLYGLLGLLDRLWWGAILAALGAVTYVFAVTRLVRGGALSDHPWRALLVGCALTSVVVVVLGQAVSGVGGLGVMSPTFLVGAVIGLVLTLLVTRLAGASTAIGQRVVAVVLGAMTFGTMVCLGLFVIIAHSYATGML